MRALRTWVLTAISSLLMMVPTLAHSQTLTAMWDPNPPSDAVTSYEICIGTTSLSCNFQSATVGASETSYTFAPNPGVLYRVAVRSINAAGPGPFSPEVAISIPGLTQPANQTSQVNVPISPLSLSASDPDGGTIQFTHSGLPFGLSLNQSTGIITGTPTSAGTSSVIIFVSDDTVTTSRSFVWTVNTGSSSDTTAPTLAITSHTSGQTVSSANITLAGTATDSGAGGSGITGVTVNGAAATAGSASGNNTANWNRGVTLTVGANAFTIVATDGAGNVRTSNITINRSAADTTAPTLTITSHTAGQTVSSSNITLSGTATDSGVGGSGITSVTVNGSSTTGGSATGSNTANWSRSINLSTGANTVTVVATDGAGNARTTPITITYAISAVTSVTLTPSLASPRLTGTAISWTAAGSGGVGPRQYKFLVQQGSGSPQVVRDWSTTATYSWTPATAASYTVSVWARSAGVTADAAQASTQASYVITAPVGPLVPTAITPNLPSPQNAGTTVTFTAAATGGVAPLSFKWWVLVDGAWTLARDWSTSPTFAWTPSAAGSYSIGIWVRDANTSADTNAVNFAIPYTVTGGPTAAPPTPTTPITVTAIQADQASPRTVGTTVTFTPVATGGAAPYSYKWWILANGAWTLARDWSTSPSFAWTPSAAGSYSIGIWVRGANTTADTNAVNFAVPYVVTGGASAPPTPPSTPTTPITVTTILADQASPRAVGTTVTFTPVATGGTGPYSFKWWVLVNGAWTLARDWSTSPSFSWTPSAAGSYSIGIWVRGANTTADTNAVNFAVPYVVTGGASAPPPSTPTTPITATAIVADKASPRSVGTTVTFAPVASGGTAPYSYKWWIQTGGAWTLARDWSTAPTFSWTPSAAGSYQIGVWVRGANTTADTNAVNFAIPYVVTTGTSAPPSGGPLTIVNIATNVPSPASVGQSVTATAWASGGSAPYQFKWWMFNGATWVMVRDWGSNTLTFTPVQANVNPNFRIGVWARSAGSTDDTGSVNFAIPFPIVP